MRKSIISILIAAVLCCAVFALAGCADKSDNIKTITDISFYSDMQAGGDKIDVHFENGTRYGFDFTIKDKTEIEEVVNSVLTTNLTNVGKEPVAPGDNTYFTVYQGTKAYGIALSGVEEGGNRYAFSERDLRDKISHFAEAAGAFDTEVGVIYKVIDLSDIESIKEEKITVTDKAALLNLIESNYGDCSYLFVYDSESLAEPYSLGLTENGKEANSYTDTLTAGKGKLLVMYHIYQAYNSYYVTSPSMSEINLGNSDKSYMEFDFGLWHHYDLKITVIS